MGHDDDATPRPSRSREPALLADELRDGSRPRRSATRSWPSAARSTGAWAARCCRVKNRDYFFDHTSKDVATYDSERRSVYLPVVRNHLYDVFQLFDYSPIRA